MNILILAIICFTYIAQVANATTINCKIKLPEPGSRYAKELL